MRRFLLLLTFFPTLLLADEAKDIIKNLDLNMRGKSVYMKLSMSVKSLRHKRTMGMESWSRGSKKSFVKIIYPPKERGITFLSLDGQMWQYVPKIERIIKIPPSMMLQSWMGSDITNDDMVKQSSLVDDYHAKLLKKEGAVATIELIPKENAPVIWGKIVTTVDTTHYTGIKDVFYDESGKEVRTFSYEKVKQFGKYYIPTVWTIRPTDKKSNLTTLAVEEAKYDDDIGDAYFRKSALKRFSR